MSNEQTHLGVGDVIPSVLIQSVADSIAYSGRCLLRFVSLSAVGGVSVVTIRNGTNALGEAKLTLRALENDTRVAALPKPVFLEFGCFVDHDATASEVTVQVEPVVESLGRE